MAISFGGAQITRPGSYSVVDTASMVVSSIGSFRSLAFIGVAPLLKAGTDVTKPLVFSAATTSDAAAILGAGDLLTHMNKAWQHGADLIYVSVVTPAASTPTDAEWQTAVDRLNKVYVDGVVPISTTGSIIAKLHTHCTTMSTILNRKERRGFYGHAKGSTVSAITTLVASANTERAFFASPAVYDYDATGTKVLYDATLLAAACAGLWAGKDPQDPITYDYVTFAGTEVDYEQSDISTLLTAGVSPLETTRTGYRIVQGRTGTASTTDVSQIELSVSTLKDVMSIDMREFLEEKYVGTAGVAGTSVTIYNDALSRILTYISNGWISSYVDGTLKVNRTGTSYTVEYQAVPTLPINNFLITSHFKL